MRAYEINGKKFNEYVNPDTVQRLRQALEKPSAEPVAEYINKQVLKSGWKDTQTILGRYRLEAQVKDWMDKPRLFINVYDDHAPGWEKGSKTTSEVADAKFSPRGLFFKDLVADMIHVRGEYRRQGVATAIYKYVHSLGNSVKPSVAQLPAGKAMWQGFQTKGGIKNLE